MSASIYGRLSLCHGTLIGVEPPTFVDAAAAAGFRRVSLRIMSPKSGVPGRVMGHYPMLGDTEMRRETKRRLDANGMSATEAEAAVINPDTDIAGLADFMDSAAYLGCVGAIPVFFGQTSEQQVLDQYGQFSALAAERGLKSLIEFIALSEIKTLAAAARVISAAGAANGAIIIDSLHLVRSGGAPSDIDTVDPKLINSAQINDGLVDWPNEDGRWWHEMSMARGFLGEGDFPVKDMVAHLPPDIPIGVEVISKEFQERGLDAAAMAQFAMDNVRSYFGPEA